MNDIKLYSILKAIKDADNYRTARTLADATLTPDTVIPARFFKYALMARLNMYNPADYGRFGKHIECAERVARWLDGGRLWAHWSEFHARRHGLADIGDRTENKSGCGDWLYSRRYSDWDRIVEEYANKHTMIRWATADFTIECEWAELLGYLAEYNDKGLRTWFKSTVKRNATLSESIVMMQEYKTSKRKTDYLVNCPYNKG